MKVLGYIFLFGLLLCAIWATANTNVSAQVTVRCAIITQTAPDGGFTVCDDDQASFLLAYERWGIQQIGYPISRRYEQDGLIVQAFQKGIMQWWPNEQQVKLVNVFDDLHNAGFDGTLSSQFQTPGQLPPDWDGSSDFQQVVLNRQALLNERPALAATYFANNDPLTFFGLPTSYVTDEGNHYAVRLQRAVLQEWKEDVPWAAAGQVTIANGGDIAKSLGALPSEAVAAIPWNEMPTPTPTSVPPTWTPVPPTWTPAPPTAVPAATVPPSGNGGTVYLTFDDGPNPAVTREIMNILDQYNARATFFVLGQSVDRFPFMLQEIYSRGHGLGNHSQNHKSLAGMGYQQFVNEIQPVTNQLGGYNSWCLRPPYGAMDSYTQSNANALGYRVMTWQVDSWDWRQQGVETIVNNVVNYVGAGSVVLMHDGGGDRSQTVAALPQILSILTQRGYRFAAVCR